MILLVVQNPFLDYGVFLCTTIYRNPSSIWKHHSLMIISNIHVLSMIPFTILFLFKAIPIHIISIDKCPCFNNQLQMYLNVSKIFPSLFEDLIIMFVPHFFLFISIGSSSIKPFLLITSTSSAYVIFTMNSWLNNILLFVCCNIKPIFELRLLIQQTFSILWIYCIHS